jgi:hypothetical protein
MYRSKKGKCIELNHEKIHVDSGLTGAQMDQFRYEFLPTSVMESISLSDQSPVTDKTRLLTN